MGRAFFRRSAGGVGRNAQNGGERGRPRNRHQLFAKAFEKIILKHRFTPFEKITGEIVPLPGIVPPSSQNRTRSVAGQKAPTTSVPSMPLRGMEFIFPGLLEHDRLSSYFTRLCLQAKTKSRQKKGPAPFQAHCCLK